MTEFGQTRGGATKTVLLLSSTSGPGGAETVVGRLAEALDRSRFRPAVALFRPGFLKDVCQENGLPVYVRAMRGMFDASWVIAALRWVRRERVRLIHAHEFTANTYGTLVARLAGVPLIATVHGKNYYWEREKRRVAYRMVSRLSTMVAVSEDLRAFLRERVGVPMARVKVIHNGVETDRHGQRAGAEKLRRELGLDTEARVVGVVASLSPIKGHRYLLEAAQRVFQACPGAAFLIVGSGPLEPELRQQANRLGCSDRVRFLGFRKDVSALLEVTDVFALPSLSEGLPLALLEAMAAGKPVVATDVGGNREAVEDGRTGFLVPAADADALAAKLVILLTDADRAATLGREGRLRALRHFSLTAMVGNYERLYEEVLGPCA